MSGELRKRIRPRRLAFSALSLAAVSLLVGAGTAPAAVVTLGSPLNAAFEPRPCSSEGSCTATIATYPEAGVQVTSPVSGVIVRWRMLQGAPPFKYKLRVLTPAGGTSYTGAGTSAAQTPAGAGLETFTTSLPINAGQAIGIDVEPNAPLGFARENGAGGLGWEPPLADGSTAPAKPFPGELAYNADVQPAPTITALKPASGSFKGGSKVVITGTDFEGAGAVAFGSVPAKSFTLDSETQITAVSPKLKALAKVPVAVTTNAGTATSATTFKGAACVVPKLKGKKLKAARKKLKKADCKLGKVKGDKSKQAKVEKQKPAPGKKLAPGAKVKVTVG